MSRHEYQWTRTKGKESAEDHSEETQRENHKVISKSNQMEDEETTSVVQEYKHAQKNRSCGKYAKRGYVVGDVGENTRTRNRLRT